MAQLRQDYEAFAQRNAVIVVVAPEKQAAVQKYWQQNDLPFIGLADHDHTVAKLYGQQVRLLKLGRMPALVLIDSEGNVQYKHRGNSMKDIPSNALILDLLDQINDAE